MQFDFSTVPIVGVVILLATTTIAPVDAWNAIVGSDTLKPYAIIILFFSLAYTSISLDCTGPVGIGSTTPFSSDLLLQVSLITLP